jgi:hypothetical protein
MKKSPGKKLRKSTADNIQPLKGGVDQKMSEHLFSKFLITFIHHNFCMCRSASFFRLIFTLIFLLFLSTLHTQAQRFGGNPPSLKWRQIDTDTVRVIFPKGLENEAARVVNMSHLLNRKTGSTMGTDQRKINIVLQKNTVVSNGYVGLAPWRSEYYMTPLQNSLQLGSLPWVDNLVIHENRHVQQYMNFRKGLSKLAYIVAGEEGLAVANSAAVPDWFFEGDAVFQETMVSRQGRGRLPDFYNGYRSLKLAGKQYSFMKLRNGSLKDYLPDHYQLGYILTTYGRKKYGDDFWKNVTQDAVRYKPLFYPFQGAVKKHAGVSYRSFVKDAFDYFNGQVPQGDATSAPLPLTALNTRYVSDYLFPNIIGEDSVLVLKRTFRHIPAWTILSGGKEHRIAVKDIDSDEYYSYKNGWIVYTSYRTDPRWSWMDYSGIFLLNIYNKQRIKLTTRTKYFSPDISRDAQKIVAVEVKPGEPSSIHIINAVSGEVISRLPNPQKYLYTYPVFNKDETQLFSAVRNDKGEMGLITKDVSSGEERIIIPFSFHVIAFPKVKGDKVVFTASHNRKSEIWIWDDTSKKLSLAVSRPTGSFQAEMDEKNQELIYSSFTAEGQQLLKEKINAAENTDPQSWIKESNEVFAGDVFRDTVLSDVLNTPQLSYADKKYKHGFRLFNVHSWRPYYDQPDWSFTIYSENILNTLRSDLYYNYNENEGYHKFGYNMNFAALYPWVTGGVSYTFDRKFSDTARAFRWNEFNANVGLRLPLNFSSGRLYKYLTIATSFNTQQLFFTQQSKPRPANYGFNYMQGSLNWTIQSQQARQHIYPRFAHTLLVQNRFSVSDITARQFFATTALYLPGVLRTHNLVLTGAYQARDTLNNYRFSNSFPFSRGYPALDFDRMWKYGANYHLPLVYPDFGLAQVVYFQRVRANLFYDVTYIKSLRGGDPIDLRSVGAEIFFDTKWWNQQSVTFGFRYSRLLDNDKFIRPPGANQWEFIMPVDLIRR